MLQNLCIFVTINSDSTFNTDMRIMTAKMDPISINILHWISCFCPYLIQWSASEGMVSQNLLNKGTKSTAE